LFAFFDIKNEKISFSLSDEVTPSSDSISVVP
jgi:hypothetical protein